MIWLAQVVKYRRAFYDEYILCFHDLTSCNLFLFLGVDICKQQFTLNCCSHSIKIVALEIDVSEFWTYSFWISSIFTLSFGMHCFITCTVINIFAPGLAIRGKPG